MKNLISILVFALCLFGFSFASNASVETISFKVSGTAACEAQIESIITNVVGVSSASWDATTQIITITFETETVRKDRFFVVLAEGGYDNQELHAKKANYDALPAACKYVRNPEND